METTLKVQTYHCYRFICWAAERRLDDAGNVTLAGNSLSIVAHGSGVPGADGDVNIQGSQLKAGKDVLLSANRDVNMVSAENSSFCGQRRL